MAKEPLKLKSPVCKVPTPPALAPGKTDAPWATAKLPINRPPPYIVFPETKATPPTELASSNAPSDMVTFFDGIVARGPSTNPPPSTVKSPANVCGFVIVNVPAPALVKLPVPEITPP